MEFRVTYKTHSLLSCKTQHMFSNVQHYEYNEFEVRVGSMVGQQRLTIGFLDFLVWPVIYETDGVRSISRTSILHHESAQRCSDISIDAYT